MEKVPKQKTVEIWPMPFQNDDTINARFDNTGKMLFAFQPKYSLRYVVYPNLKTNSSSPFNSLIILKRNSWWGINVMNDGKWISLWGKYKN